MLIYDLMSGDGVEDSIFFSDADFGNSMFLVFFFTNQDDLAVHAKTSSDI